MTDETDLGRLYVRPLDDSEGAPLVLVDGGGRTIAGQTDLEIISRVHEVPVVVVRLFYDPNGDGPGQSNWVTPWSAKVRPTPPPDRV